MNYTTLYTIKNGETLAYFMIEESGGAFKLILFLLLSWRSSKTNYFEKTIL
jgi:hypothetical protein